MASSNPSGLSMILVVFSVLFLQIHRSHSLSCSSQKFTGNRVYDQCSDLPTLGAQFHWTYDTTHKALNVAFVAPAKSDGWVSWGINPKEPEMIGAQALVAYMVDNKMTVQTFNITSYKIKPSKIDYSVSNLEAESANDTMTIFGTIALPSTMTKINHVWQVGNAVVNGIPAAHAMKKENMDAKGTLELIKLSPSPSHSPSHSPSPSPTGGPNGSPAPGPANDGAVASALSGISVFSVFAVFWFLLV